jgi:hypothetical protein
MGVQTRFFGYVCRPQPSNRAKQLITEDVAAIKSFSDRVFNDLCADRRVFTDGHPLVRCSIESNEFHRPVLAGLIEEREDFGSIIIPRLSQLVGGDLPAEPEFVASLTEIVQRHIPVIVLKSDTLEEFSDFKISEHGDLWRAIIDNSIKFGDRINRTLVGLQSARPPRSDKGAVEYKGRGKRQTRQPIVSPTVRMD